MIPNLLVTELGCRVHAVDFVAEFLTHAIDHPLLTTEVGEAATYCSAARFDAILSLGVITYLDDAGPRLDVRALRGDARPGGALLVKAQFGVHETVVVDTTPRSSARATRRSTRSSTRRSRCSPSTTT